MYNAQQKHESTLLHTYVLNEFLTADHSVEQNIFEKVIIKVSSSHLYASFGTFFASKLVNFLRHSESLKNV